MSDGTADTPAVDPVRRIGEHVSALREERGLKISDLARRIAVSPSLIGQIERGQSRPSVTTLFALAQALEVPVDAFFDVQASPLPDHSTRPELDQATARRLAESVWPDAADGSLVSYLLTAAERPRVDIRGGVRWERLTRATIPGIEFMELVYEPGAASDTQLYRHPGLECVLVTHGCFDITVGFDLHHVGVGDSMTFPSSLPHRYVNPLNEESRAITVIVRDGVSSPQDPSAGE